MIRLSCSHDWNDRFTWGHDFDEKLEKLRQEFPRYYIVSQNKKVKGKEFVCLKNGTNSFNIYESIDPDPHFTSGLCVLIASYCVSLASHCICSVLVLTKIHTSDNGIRKLGEVELQAQKNDIISMEMCFGNFFC